MKAIPVGLQLYSVREDAKAGFIDVIKKVAGFGYAGVEFAGFNDVDPVTLKKVCADLGLTVTSAHGRLPTAENAGGIIDSMKAVGCPYYICAGTGKDGCMSRESCVAVAGQFEAAARLLGAEGIKFGTHNHDYEFVDLPEGGTPHDVFMTQAPSVLAQIDTYWVKVAGKDPAEAIRRLPNRVPVVHIKDGPLDKGLPMSAVGSGKMTWKPVMDAAENAGVQWLVVEIDRCDGNMMDAVERSVKYLIDNGYGEARG